MTQVIFRCGTCWELAGECVKCERSRLDYVAETLHDEGADCGREDCQQCCPHDERDHGICLYCAHEQDPGEAIDRAMDSIDTER